ncbi:class I SAM-dependent methyltransferase [Nocardioides sp. LHD-245]|uniref:class I SAM-dependent methyltransferase n=1 Tax=Nocardioides sp. LHD-245 TaxID=3051387 RepID=UPI0027E0FEB1|nr:class I SAM-dependent methyltransferase [Nocardioides sp. LHD-245]
MFEVAADAYVRFMGTFSGPLAGLFADVGLAGVDPTAPVLDVGCGPGMLTAELVRRRGAPDVAAVDPVASFVAATAAAHPEADVRAASAEALPFADAAFGATLAQLAVNFMTDPAAGTSEMRRVTRPGGRVSACVWDHAGGRGPLSPLWGAARALDPAVGGEGALPGAHGGDLTALLGAAGLREVTEVELTVAVRFARFADWWEPYTLGVGPAGAYVAGLDDPTRERLESDLLRELGPGPFTVVGTAWAASGVV